MCRPRAAAVLNATPAALTDGRRNKEGLLCPAGLKTLRVGHVRLEGGDHHPIREEYLEPCARHTRLPDGHTRVSHVTIIHGAAMRTLAIRGSCIHNMSLCIHKEMLCIHNGARQRMCIHKLSTCIHIRTWASRAMCIHEYSIVYTTPYSCIHQSGDVYTQVWMGVYTSVPSMRLT